MDSIGGRVALNGHWNRVSRPGIINKNGDYLQSICLIMGNNSIDFHDALREYIYSKNDTSYETIMSMENIKMTLHGTEDIEVELPNTFLLDFLFTDWIFSDEDYPAVIKMSKIPTTFNIKTNNEFDSSDILPLGNNEDFAIRTNGSYVYNTASSDLSGYETTDKWLFNYDDNLTCIVHGYTESADISYYPTDDNSKLSSWELIKRCFELAFYENANIFKDPITIRRDGSKLIVTSVDDLVEGNIYYAYTFVILKNGIVHIASNSTGNDNAIHFVAEIAGSILSKDENDFITNIIP